MHADAARAGAEAGQRPLFSAASSAQLTMKNLGRSSVQNKEEGGAQLCGVWTAHGVGGDTDRFLCAAQQPAQHQNHLPHTLKPELFAQECTTSHTHTH